MSGEGWIPDKSLTLFEGPGGVGKLTVLLDLAAKATRGFAFPGEESEREPIKCALDSSRGRP